MNPEYMYPLVLVGNIWGFELPGNGSDLRTPNVITYMRFKFCELWWFMPKVLSSSLCCLNVVCAFHQAHVKMLYVA